MWYPIQALGALPLISYRGVEQLVARRAHNPEVAGSSPVSATKSVTVVDTISTTVIFYFPLVLGAYRMKMGVFQSFSALTGCTAPSAAAGCSPKHGFAGIAIVIRYKRYANLKYKYGNRHFWCRGYYVSTVGANRKAIQEYIRNQLQKDYTDDQMSIKEHVDPFKGQPITEGK